MGIRPALILPGGRDVIALLQLQLLRGVVYAVVGSAPGPRRRGRAAQRVVYRLPPDYGLLLVGLSEEAALADELAGGGLALV